VSRWFVIACVATVACGSQEAHGTSAEANVTPEPLPGVTPAAPENVAKDPAAEATAAGAPLRDWMVANLNRPLRTVDFTALGRSLSTAATYAPEQFPDWRRIAQQGVDAAAAHDLDGVRASCSECHTKYRADYRKNLRSQPLNVSEPRF
jgi:hypothetical protein